MARRRRAAWSTWQHATPGPAAAACPRYQHVRGGCSQRSVCRQPVCRVSARTCTCAPTVRCAPTAQLWNRWPHVRSMWPVPFPVARRPSLHRAQPSDDRRRCDTHSEPLCSSPVTTEPVTRKNPTQYTDWCRIARCSAVSTLARGGPEGECDYPRRNAGQAASLNPQPPKLCMMPDASSISLDDLLLV